MNRKLFFSQVVMLLFLTSCSGSTNTRNKQAEEKAQVGDHVVVEINETEFPDNGFRSFLLSKEYGFDGILTKEELDKVKELLVPFKKIENLKGIEHFTSLQTLNCSMNSLTSLDVSHLRQLKTLQCYGNNLTELDLTNNTKLEIAYCDQNKLNSLRVPNTPSLIVVSFSENQMKGDALDKLIEELPNASSSKTHYFTVCGREIQKEKNKWTKKQLNKVRAKGWTPYNMKGEEL